FAKRGHSFKDWICPNTMEFATDYFKIDGRYGRVLFMQDYANYVKDETVSELCSLSRDLMLSIDILPVPTDEAVREIQNKLLGVETNVTNWQRRQNANNNFSAVVPYDMELQRKETKEMLDDLTTRDQRMMFGLLTLVHMADTKEQLDSDTDTLLSSARKSLCQMAVLKWQQVDGIQTVLPYGLRKINALRTMTTESTAVLIPFHAQEIMQPGGIYYGQNAVSKNMLVADRKKLLNGNSFRLGVSGSGKSFSAKEEIVDLALSTEDDILILDPESEFTSLVEALNGEVIHISATSDTHLNALDMDSAYGDDRNPLIEKSEFILSLFEQLVGAGNLSAKEKSILDRCTADVYRDYINSGYQGKPPTLKELYRQLMLQPEEEARGLALSSELFINGSLNTFAQHTNVNTKSRIIGYDIRELGEQLMPLGMLVTLDSIFNRVIQNWRKGKTTWVFADEFYLLFRYQYSADFFYRLYKRIRKYFGFVNGLTQNVEELLKSDAARLMLANSEFLILLNQSSTDREELAKLLNISDNQLSYITNVGAGHGLIRCAGNIVPFENSFPKGTKLYKLMSTSPMDARS
ncbi:MAG: TraE family protein, partial [Lachnospiraceae bacterium]|nr:TraE family protein [Lachnospiraceae bacterium]